MKFWLVILLLCGAAFSLCAQTILEGVPIFVPPVSGEGSTPEDNEELTTILDIELQGRNFILMDTQEEADYTLVAVISAIIPEVEDTEPLAEDDEEIDTEPEEPEITYKLSLALQDKDGLTLYEQDLFYSTLDEANTFLPTTLLVMLSQVFEMYVYIPPEEVEPEPIDLDIWRKQPWYFGAGAFWNPRLYYGNKMEADFLNFGFGASAEYHFIQFSESNEKLKFLRYLAVGTGLEFGYDWIVASPRPGDQYWNSILQFPFTVKGVIRPPKTTQKIIYDEKTDEKETIDIGNRYFHQIYAGVILNVPLHKYTRPFIASGMAGFQFGMRAGQGIFYADTHYAMDFGKSSLNETRMFIYTPEFYRYMIYLGVGYKHEYNVNEAIGRLIKKIRDARNAEREVNEREELERLMKKFNVEQADSK